MQRRHFLVAGVAAQCAFPALAADEYPDRVVKIIVPFAAGGGFDAIARPFAEKLSANLKQAVIVENKAGAGGGIGATFVARAAPDGYTLLFANSSLVTQPLLQKTPTYDPVKDFAAVSRVGSVSTALAINPKLPAQNLKELVELSQRKPLSVGTPGIGTSPHLVAELMNLNGTMKIIHVPYKGTAPAIADAVAGQTDMVMVPISALAPMIRAGKLRGMAVLSAARASVMPDLPTFGERGLPDPHGETWYGVFAPAKTPAAIVQRLNAASVQAISQPELVQALRDAGYETGSSTPENLAATVKADLLRWARVVREAKIQLD